MTAPAPILSIPKTIVFIGMMGAGKSRIGRMLAEKLGLPFFDADTEIATAANCSINEIFERHGEDSFREGERRVIARLLAGPVHILATGGGAFMDAQTRALIEKKALTIWLRADLEILLQRVKRRNTRPLLKKGDPREILERLITERYPVYGHADIIIDSMDAPPEETAQRVYDSLASYLEKNNP